MTPRIDFRFDYPKVFSFTSHSKHVLKNSSSGGAFYTLAKYVIEQGGVVFGAKVNDNGEIIHSSSDRIDGIEEFMRSKYAQSKLGEAFKKCLSEVMTGRLVLFTGTPCQVNALHAFLDMNGVEKTHLITADFVCHGVPKAKIWNQYLAEINYTPGHPINFRLKQPSWEHYSIQIGDIVRPAGSDPYMWLFLHNYSLDESCFHCKCKGEHRLSDITLGDFSGVRDVDGSSYNKNGTSMLVIRKRLPLFSRIFGAALNPFPYSVSVCCNPSYTSSADMPPHYHDVDNMLLTHTIAETAALLGMPQNNKLSFGFQPRKAFRALLSSIRYVQPKHHLLREYKYRPQDNLVGIVSDFGYENFGNKLQNYALKHIIESRYDMQCINVVYKSNPPFRFPLLERVLCTIRKRNTSAASKRATARRKCIRTTSLKYEKNWVYRATIKNEKRLLRFQRIVFGSDQIWNYSYHTRDLAFNLGHLGIIGTPIPLHSYAASLCQTKLPDSLLPLYGEGLAAFSSVSVRESEAQRLLDTTLGLASEVTLDPTLLLSKEDWLNAAARFAAQSIPSKPYILVYVLGENAGEVELPYPFASEEKLIVNLSNPRDPFYCSNQFDFINLIASSQGVCTDSFHALLFSLLFQKRCFVFPRANQKGMGERVKNLLQILGISCTGLDGKLVQAEKSLDQYPYFQKKLHDSFGFLDNVFGHNSRTQKTKLEK